MIIPINRKLRLYKLKEPNAWQLQFFSPHRVWVTVETLNTTRKGIEHFLDERGLELSREGERILATLPETEKGFRAGSGLEQ